MSKDQGRKLVKAISVIAGAVGLGFIIFSVFLTYSSLKNSNFATVLFLVYGVLFGSAYIWVAYENIKRFSEKSIKMLALILTISISGTVIRSFSESINSADLVAGPYQNLTGSLAIPLLYAVYLMLLITFKKISL